MDFNSRTNYDLSHYSFMVGNIGQLQTLSIIPVNAGDSMSIDFGGVFRLAPLRRNLMLDAIVETFLFFVPHRHVYTTDWTDFIKAGQDETTTLGSRTLTAATECLGTKTTAGQVVPAWLVAGYLNIFNRYFKHPNDADLSLNYFDAIAAGDDRLPYGLFCGFPKRVWNSFADTQVTTADYRFALTDTNTTVDLLSMAQTKGLLKSERRREFYAQRYNEIMNAQWGSNINTDADPRPTLLAHEKGYLGGSDVMGTDDATLGKYTGVAKGLHPLRMPRKFFNEHGVIWAMALVRFDPVCELEINYLANISNPSYDQIAGDPEIIKTRAPIQHDLSKYLLGSALTSGIGVIPFGQWYREHENRVHQKYRDIAGHPFISASFSAVADLKYMPASTYASMFSSTEMAQWQSYGRFNINVSRLVPEVSTSVFAGTN